MVYDTILLLCLALSLSISSPDKDIAQTTCDIHNIVSSRISDIKGNSGGPFIQAFGSYDDHDKKSYSIWSRSKTHGILGGFDFVKDLKSGAQVSYGGMLSYSSRDIRLRGGINAADLVLPADASEINVKMTSIRQKLLFIGGFAAYENFNENSLKTNASIMIGYGHGRNHDNAVLSPNSGTVYYSHTRHSGNDFYIGLEVIKNVKRFDNGIQFGPWACASYNRYSQEAYFTADEGALSGKMHTNSVNTTLGVSCEQEFHNVGAAPHTLKVGVKAGWVYTSFYSRSFNLSPSQRLDFDLHLPKTHSHSLVLSSNLNYKLDEHWEIGGSATCRIGGHNKYVQASANVGYSF